MEHKDISTGELHPVPNWIVADDEALELLEVAEADVHKWAYVEGSDTFYALMSVFEATGNWKLTVPANVYDGNVTLALSTKVDKEAGKSLVANAAITKLENLPTNATLNGQLEQKVDKVAGKGLSSNDFTNAQAVQLANAAQRSELGTAAAGTLTVSVFDQTFGRVMKLGDLGYGGDVPTYTANLDDRVQRGWSYASVVAGTEGTFPPGYNFGLVHTIGAGYANDQTVQECHVITGANVPLPKFIRTSYGIDMGWTAWRRVMDSESIIAPLALGGWCQIDRTAAGDVYRYADGRMRIDTPWTTGYDSASIVAITLPASFYGSANVQVEIHPYGLWVVANTASWANGSWCEISFDSSSTDNRWRLSIEGRWKE